MYHEPSSRGYRVRGAGVGGLVDTQSRVRGAGFLPAQFRALRFGRAATAEVLKPGQLKSKTANAQTKPPKPQKLQNTLALCMIPRLQDPRNCAARFRVRAPDISKNHLKPSNPNPKPCTLTKGCTEVLSK